MADESQQISAARERQRQKGTRERIGEGFSDPGVFIAGK